MILNVRVFSVVPNLKFFSVNGNAECSLRKSLGIVIRSVTAKSRQNVRLNFGTKICPKSPNFFFV